MNIFGVVGSMSALPSAYTRWYYRRLYLDDAFTQDKDYNKSGTWSKTFSRPIIFCSLNDAQTVNGLTYLFISKDFGTLRDTRGANILLSYEEGYAVTGTSFSPEYTSGLRVDMSNNWKTVTVTLSSFSEGLDIGVVY